MSFAVLKRPPTSFFFLFLPHRPRQSGGASPPERRPPPLPPLWGEHWVRLYKSHRPLMELHKGDGKKHKENPLFSRYSQ